MTAEHGTLARYTGSARCRCQECKFAHAAYQREYQRSIRAQAAAYRQSRLDLQAIAEAARKLDLALERQVYSTVTVGDRDITVSTPTGGNHV